MAVYSKTQLLEQQEMISVIRVLTALTVIRLNRIYQTITETRELLLKIDESVKRVFEIYPSSDPMYLKKRQEFLAKKQKNAPVKTILVYVAANQDLYGDLIWNICRLFIEDFKKTGFDALVIGTLGKILLAKQNVSSSKIRFFDVDDDHPNLAVVQQILEILEGYDKVIVYHGKSESLLKQVAVKSELLKEIPEFTKPTKKYIFEPNSEEVLSFLETQVSINSFHQRIYEAQYARLAAKRWNWTKQQMARSRLLEELSRDYLKYKKSSSQKQQQVSIFAHRQNIIDDPNIRNTNIYGR